jgi:NADH-quinone oxidoreductase subunit M
MFLMGLKVGVYGFIRFVLPLVPDAVMEWSWLMSGLGVTAILYGGFIALVQVNLRRLLAFAAVSHAGLAIMGVFTLGVQGIQGSLLLMFNLGIVSTGLLLLTGLLHARTGSSELSAFGGIASQAPLLATFFFIIGLAAIGLPGTSGFPGEFLILLGAFGVHWALAGAGVAGVVLSAAYFLSYYEGAFLGPAPRHGRYIPDLRRHEIAIAAGLTLLIFWIGLFPGPFLHITSGSVLALVQRLN